MKFNRSAGLPIMLLALALAGCGQAQASSEATSVSELPSISELPPISEIPSASEADSSEADISVAPISGWGEDALSLFADHLYGIELPFVDLEATDVQYVSFIDEIVVTGEGVAEGDLDAYAALFSEEDGWKGGDISEANGLPEGTAFSFLREIETEEGNRFVYVVFYGVSEDEDGNRFYSDHGDFHLEAYDPYYYEWPTEAAEAIADLVFNFNLVDKATTLPAFEGADYYSVSSDDRGIYCFLENTTGKDDCGYGDILEEAGWTILEERLEGYHVAISPNKDYQVEYLYDDKFSDLDIFLDEYKLPLEPFDSWQEGWISDVLDDYNFPTFDIPALESENEAAEYYFYEDEDNFYSYIFDEYADMKIYVEVHNTMPSEFDLYVQDAIDAGWTADGSGDLYTLSKEIDGHYIAHFDLEYDASISGVIFTVYMAMEEKPFETWPSEVIQAELATLIDGDPSTSLPAFAGENNGFKVNGNIIIVFVNEGNEQAAIASYVASLEEAGFVIDEESGLYVDPSGEYRVSVTESYDYQGIEIYLSDMPEEVIEYTSWPNEAIAEAVGELADPIPSFNGADKYRVYITRYDEGDVLGFIECEFDEMELSDLTPAIEAYYSALEAAGYTYRDLGSFDQKRYNSPNNEYVIDVEAEEYDGYTIVKVNFDNLIDGVL